MIFHPKNGEKLNNQCAPRKKLGAAWLCAGLWFLFNPEVMLLDILPDFLGYACLLMGLYQLADLSPKLAEAFCGFRRLMFASFAQTLIFTVLITRMSQNEQPVSFLLWVFVFLILNLLLGVPTWVKFFDGLLYLGLRHEGQAILAPTRRLEKKHRKGTSVTLILQRFTCVFCVLKSLFPLLAEWSVLSMYDHQEDYRVRNWYEYIDMYRTLVILIGLLIGGIWLWSMWRYLRRVLRDTPFWERTEALFAATVTPDEGLWVTRRVHWGFLTLIAGIALRTELYIDEVNRIPEWVAPLVIAAGVVILWRYLSRKMPVFLSLGALTAVGILVRFFNRDFYRRFNTPSAVLKNSAALTAHVWLCAWTLLEQILFLIVLFFLCRSLRGLIHNLTGFPPKCDGMPDRTGEIHRGETLRVFLTFIPAALAAVGSVAYRVFLPWIGSLWLAQVVLSVALAVYFGYALSTVEEQVRRRFWFMKADEARGE